MIPQTEYQRLKGIHDATVYRWINAGKILKIGKNIYDPQMEKLSDQSKEVLISEKKREFEALILKAHYDESLIVSTVATISEDVKHFAALGMNIIGYAERSLYRKIKNPSQLKRKERRDAGIIMNKNLQECYEQFISIASNHFIANKGKSSSINLAIDLTIYEAKKNEDLYRIAAVPKATLYRAFNNHIKSHSLDEIHSYLNHHNIWDGQKQKVTGAFTDDINFMDFLIGDDHKFDIHKVLEFSPLRNKFEGKTLYSYFWSEAKTQKVLSYMVKTSEILADDVVLLLMHALKQVGKPNNAVLVDNGRINRSEEFQTFCNKLRVSSTDWKELSIKYSKPYQGQEKSTGERLFGFVKNEHDVFFNNFTGSDHKNEGAHQTLSLTPAEPNYTINDFIKSLDNYITGFYQERPRQKHIYGKKTTISIKDYYNNEWMKFEPALVSDRELRHAYMKEFDTVKEFRNQLTFKGETYNAMEDLGISYNGKKYSIAFNPHDLSSIDLYAAQKFIDTKTGEWISIGKYIVTLYRTRTLGDVKLSTIQANNKAHKKQVKEMAEQYIDTTLTHNPYLNDKVNSQVTESGKVKHTRKAIVKTMMNHIESALPLDQVSAIISNEADKNRLSIEIRPEDDILMTGAENESEDTNFENDVLFQDI